MEAYFLKMEYNLMGQILFILVLIGINAFFAASEIALISLNDMKIKHMAEEGDKKARKINNLIKEPSRFLATIQVGITLAGFLASASAAVTIANVLSNYLKTFNIPFISQSSEGISIFLVTVLVSYLSLVLGELAPKRIAMEKAESIARFVSGPIDIFSKITSPFIKALTASTNFIIKIFGMDPNFNQDKITEEEIRMMINVGEEKGVLMESEKEMIDSIFEFDDTFVKEVMTPRTDMMCISVDATLDEIIDLTVNERFSRIPVYEGNIDKIIGILNVKDLFNVFKYNSQGDFSVRDYLRKALFIPENQKTDIALRTLQAKRTEMAIIIDEYGGTAGLITTEDLVEEIVGNILDEYDEEEKDIEKIDDNTYIVSGQLSISDVNDSLDVDISEEGADTIGGFVLGIMGRIPESYEKPTIEHEDLVFKIEEMDDRRAARVKIGINRKVEEDEDNNGR